MIDEGRASFLAHARKRKMRARNGRTNRSFLFHARTSNNSHTYFSPVPMTQARPFLVLFYHSHRIEPRKLWITHNYFVLTVNFSFFFFRLKTCAQLSREKHAWRWGQNQLLLMMLIVSFLHNLYVWFSMCYLFPQQLSVNNFKEQIRSYGRGSPTHSDQLDSQQCKGNTTFGSGYDTELASWRYSIARPRYSIGKVTILFWRGYLAETELQRTAWDRKSVV